MEEEKGKMGGTNDELMSRVGLKEQFWMVRSEHHHPFIIFLSFSLLGVFALEVTRSK